MSQSIDQIAAQQSLAHSWNALEAIGDGIYTIDVNGDCLFVNAAALHILGYADAADLVGRNMHDVIHHTRADGTEYPREACPLLQTGRGGHAVRLASETLWRRDGTAFIAEYSAFPLHERAGQTGQVIGSVVTFRAESVRNNATVRLAVQNAVGQVLAGNAGITATMDGVLRAIGSGLGWDRGRFWRYDASEVQLAAEWHDPSVPDLATANPSRPGPAARAFAAKRAIHEVGIGVPSDAVTANARCAFAFPVGVGKDFSGAIEFFGVPSMPVDDSLLSAAEVIGQTIGQALERFRVTAALRNSESRLRAMSNALPQLSWVTAADGSITWYNQRWYDYTGTTFEQMKGWGWAVVHHPDHIERVERGFRAALAVGETWEDTFPLRAADGSYRWFLSRAMPIRAETETPDIQGEIVSWFGFNIDITAMRDAERSQIAALDEAEAANLAKSLFLANMSHELRTPLSAIIGYAEMLIEEVEDGEDAAQVIGDVRKIETNARHLLGLINDVLDLSKVESGKMEAFGENFDIASIVHDVEATAGTLVQKNGNELRVELGVDLGTMYSDVTRIRQMLLNLLSNAAKFTTNGTITLAVERETALQGSDWIRFAVTDTGLGMSEDQLAKLFQRFQQADISTTRKFGGTGLGLSLTRVFSHLLGGDIAVQSALGTGSVFTIRLPASLPAAVPTEAELIATSQDRELVLVIDDDETQRELASRFLERTGFAPVTAADGATGLALARDLHPHAILLDVTMPGMDGWSVLSILKAEPATAGIPVIMVTLADAQPLAESLGAADYIRKPVEWDRLRNVLDRFRDAEGDILVVDDEPDVRQRLRRILESNGWSVSEAVNGRDALAQVAIAVPRVILLDLVMPEMDGFEFIRLLRERPGCGTVPVIVLTAKDLTLDDRRRLRGANQVLNKGSVSLNELVERLHKLEVLTGPTLQPATTL